MYCFMVKLKVPTFILIFFLHRVLVQNNLTYQAIVENPQNKNPITNYNYSIKLSVARASAT